MKELVDITKELLEVLKETANSKPAQEIIKLQIIKLKWAVYWGMLEDILQIIMFIGIAILAVNFAIFIYKDLKNS